MRVLVTGANGFVGTALCARLARDGVDTVAAVRRESAVVSKGVVPAIVGELDDRTQWSRALEGVSHVVHLAGRAHVMHEHDDEAEPEFRRVNVAGTVALARQAAAAGVRQFVFVSSVKVHGEERDTPYAECDTPRPEGAYARSKWEAERCLREIEQATAMPVTVVRPPLVYGPRVKANFLVLMNAIDKRRPLPFRSLRNRRSLIFSGNLADALTRCVQNEAAAGRTYLVSDGHDVSTPDLIRMLATAMGVAPRLVPMPSACLRAGARLLGRGEQIDRLVGSLTVVMTAIRSEIGWMPPVTLEQGLALTAEDYRTRHAR